MTSTLKRADAAYADLSNVCPASEMQVGGTHYRNMSIQPSEFIYKNRLNWLQGNAIKYICRHAAKDGLEDLLKAKHYLDLLIEWEYGNERTKD